MSCFDMEIWKANFSARIVANSLSERADGLNVRTCCERISGQETRAGALTNGTLSFFEALELDKIV
jgi:hypothetical protein